MSLETVAFRGFGRAFDFSSSPNLAEVVDTLAAGQKRVKEMAAEFESQRRQSAQATLDQTKKSVLESLRGAKQMIALGGDMTAMVNMVESSMRLAQPAIKTLRGGITDAKTMIAFTKQVGDLTNVAEQVGLMARIAARDPATERRVKKSWTALVATLRDVRGQTGFRIFV